MEQLHPEVKFVEYVFSQLTDTPEAIEIVRTEDELGVLITAHVPQPLMGKVIGKSGKHVEALKTLLKVVGAKLGYKIALKVVEKE